MTARYSEDELIDRLFRPLAGPHAAAFFDDDAAFLPPAGHVVTVDALVAGVHFFAEDPPGAIAKKALRVNLSDLAAKGATPSAFLLTLCLPEGWTNAWLEAFAEGLREDAAHYGVALIGGDTVRTPGPLTLSITAFGRTDAAYPRRSGARPGDAIYVSGTIGDAALGLAVRQDPALAAALSPQARDFLLERYLLPRPRVALAPIVRRFASAAMDVSDGLIGDLSRIMRASGVGAEARLEDVPLSSAAQEAVALRPKLLETALTGGDDYEILCCLEDESGPAFEAAARAASETVTQIGSVGSPDSSVRFLTAEGGERCFARPSFTHY